MADVCRGVRNTLKPNIVLKIHPAIGIARVGDHPTAYFIGPEKPGEPAKPPGGRFKDGGQVKRQAARFRIFDYGDKAKPNCIPQEVNLDTPEVAEIQWSVHVANRKASFFKFNGTAGEDSPYAKKPFQGGGAAAVGGLDVDKEPRRNSKVPVADRPSKLEIDPGEKIWAISTANKGRVSDGPEFTNPAHPGIPIKTLGEMKADEVGNLLVLGGHGTSAASATLPVPIVTVPSVAHPDPIVYPRSGVTLPLGATARPVPLLHYANNDTWFDDVSDGTVKARVKFKSGKIVSAQGAWVIVGPPDFAPAIGNVVSLYDALYDVAVRHLTLPADNPIYTEYEAGKGLKRLADVKRIGLANYQPSFKREIGPMLSRTMNMKWVHRPLDSSAFPGPPKLPPFSQHDGFSLTDLGDPTLRSADPSRHYFFMLLRTSGSPSHIKNSGLVAMPKLLGDEPYDASTSNQRYRLTLTPTQLAMMRQWDKGKFVTGSDPSSVITPEGLDQAALENCVGGAFFPGIEAGWMLRNPKIYSEPFRIKEGVTLHLKFLKNDLATMQSVSLTVRPGFFSQQMALPWQSDFHDCALEVHDPDPPPPPDGISWGWWPGQRPDVAQVGSGSSDMKPWIRSSGAPWPDTLDKDSCSHEEMVKHVMKFGFVKEDPAKPGEFVEDERNIP